MVLRDGILPLLNLLYVHVPAGAETHIMLQHSFFVRMEADHCFCFGSTHPALLHSSDDINMEVWPHCVIWSRGLLLHVGEWGNITNFIQCVLKHAIAPNHI